jgi:hypothetical protein
MRPWSWTAVSECYSGRDDDPSFVAQRDNPNRAERDSLSVSEARRDRAEARGKLTPGFNPGITIQNAARPEGGASILPQLNGTIT